MQHKRKRFFFILYFCGLIVVPLVLLFLPANFFDSGQSVCLSVVLFDTTCYGCGMTRAIQHLIHFDFAQASFYNKLSFIVFPLLVIAYLQELWRVKNKILAKNIKPNSSENS